MGEREEIIALSMSFASYLVEHLPGIRRIILFGSVARGYFDRESDIDIFVDIPKKPKGAERLLEKFRHTRQYKESLLKGVSREIKPVWGDLKGKEWKSLYHSICSDGVLLYGKFEASPPGLKQHVIFAFGKIKSPKKRVYIHRRLYGYRMKGKRYPGLLESRGGERLGPGVIIFPIEDAQETRSLFRKNSVPVRIVEIWK